MIAFRPNSPWFCDCLQAQKAFLLRFLQGQHILFSECLKGWLCLGSGGLCSVTVFRHKRSWFWIVLQVHQALVLWLLSSELPSCSTGFGSVLPSVITGFISVSVSARVSLGLVMSFKHNRFWFHGYLQTQFVVLCGNLGSMIVFRPTSLESGAVFMPRKPYFSDCIQNQQTLVL